MTEDNERLPFGEHNDSIVKFVMKALEEAGAEPRFRPDADTETLRFPFGARRDLYVEDVLRSGGGIRLRYQIESDVVFDRLVEVDGELESARDQTERLVSRIVHIRSIDDAPDEPEENQIEEENERGRFDVEVGEQTDDFSAEAVRRAEEAGDDPRQPESSGGSATDTLENLLSSREKLIEQEDEDGEDEQQDDTKEEVEAT